jgi:hypothetical protein
MLPGTKRVQPVVPVVGPERGMNGLEGLSGALQGIGRLPVHSEPAEGEQELAVDTQLHTGHRRGYLLQQPLS